MDISDKDLLESALSDELPEVTEQVAPEQHQPRDDQGRFAERTEQPEQQPEVAETKPAAPEPQQESRGVRELREALERSERRAQDIERQLRQMQQPKPEAPAKPDVFENPDEFVRQGVQQQVDPVKAHVNGVVEFFSRRDAIRSHGEEKVKAAYAALDKAALAGDPMALATVKAVKESMDPYGDMVAWHTKNEVGADPDAYFNRRLEEAMKDEKFRGEIMSKLQPEPKPVVKLPPSLSRVASAAAALEEGGDMSNESLFAHAMR